MFSRVTKSVIAQVVSRGDLTLSRHVSTLGLSSCKKFLVVNEPGKQLNHVKFPLVWLRDNCQCSHCFHPEVNRRILDWNQFEFDQKLKSFSVRCYTDYRCSSPGPK